MLKYHIGFIINPEQKWRNNVNDIELIALPKSALNNFQTLIQFSKCTISEFLRSNEVPRITYLESRETQNQLKRNIHSLKT